MILKIINGKLELHKENGNFIRTICSNDVIDADLSKDETLVVVTFKNGKVELRKENGNFVRTIVMSKATRARFQSSDIAITLDNGKIELRKENGNFIRTI